MNDDCVFCKIVSKVMPPRKIFYEDEEILAFPSIAPQAPVHILIIPKKHIRDVNAVTEAQAALLGRMVLVARDLAKKQGIDQTGYRLAFNTGPHAGQSVFHLHLHLLGGRPFDEEG